MREHIPHDIKENIKSSMKKNIKWLIQEINNNTYKTYDMDDPFMCMITKYVTDIRGINMKQAKEYDIIKRCVSQKLGDFWQNLLGDARGWKNLHTGHESGCDLYNENLNMYIELKNKWNTMNSSSQNAIINKLKKLENDSIGCIGIINDKKKEGNISYKEDVMIITGGKLFEYIYGYDVQNEIWEQFYIHFQGKEEDESEPEQQPQGEDEEEPKEESYVNDITNQLVQLILEQP